MGKLCQVTIDGSRQMISLQRHFNSKQVKSIIEIKCTKQRKFIIFNFFFFFSNNGFVISVFVVVKKNRRQRPHIFLSWFVGLRGESPFAFVIRTIKKKNCISQFFYIPWISLTPAGEVKEGGKGERQESCLQDEAEPKNKLNMLSLE